ncbi:response regulator transcription factor [Dehalococcoides mccartyi]|uniref:response regulator transcription factor n=1 Tax=Dehalococcoides mccartyi TaxID=61435 RepID=UPI000ACC3DDB|nr:response regulator transcription factor [Dehalococcoides mccartyi]
MVTDAIRFALQIGLPEAQILNTPYGSEGLDILEEKTPDLIVLDLGLPDLDGFEIIRLIRLFSEVPIIVLTIKAEESNIVKALELGANEYVTKPFRQLELTARIRSLLRRSVGEDKELFLKWGPFSLNLLKRIVLLSGKEIPLTPIETQILRELIISAPRIVSYEKISETVADGVFLDLIKTIKVHIYHLRVKLEDDPSNPRYILNKPGQGYYLAK